MSESVKEFGTGWLPDLPDMRDWVLPSSAAPPILPPLVDLRTVVPLPIDNQLQANSCTGNGTGSLFAFVDKKQGGANIKPSRLQIYYDARFLAGLHTVDQGAYIRDALKTLALRGAAPEELWPYDLTRINVAPPQSVYDEAWLHQAIAYLRVQQTETELKACLADGYPFVIGSMLYENFYSIGADGMCPAPSGRAVGGHAYLVVGYRDFDRRFICQNSWGSGWGASGFFYVPYDYLTTGPSSDCWTIRSVEEVEPQPDPDPVPDPIPDPDPGPTPEPDKPPTIESVQPKSRDKVFVTGANFHKASVILIDGTGVKTALGADGRLVGRKLKLTAGLHAARVLNPDKQQSNEMNFSVA